MDSKKPTEKAKLRKSETSINEVNSLEKDGQNDLIDAIEQIEPIIEKLPEEERKIVMRVVLSQFKGAIPPPEILVAYNDAVPNGADRLLKMTENELQHGIEMQKTALNSSIKHTTRGQIIGFSLSIACLGISAFLGYLDHDVLAGIIATTTIIALVTTFVLGQMYQNKNK